MDEERRQRAMEFLKNRRSSEEPNPTTPDSQPTTGQATTPRASSAMDFLAPKKQVEPVATPSDISRDFVSEPEPQTEPIETGINERALSRQLARKGIPQGESMGGIPLELFEQRQQARLKEQERDFAPDEDQRSPERIQYEQIKQKIEQGGSANLTNDELAILKKGQFREIPNVIGKGLEDIIVSPINEMFTDIGETGEKKQSFLTSWAEQSANVAKAPLKMAGEIFGKVLGVVPAEAKDWTVDKAKGVASNFWEGLSEQEKEEWKNQFEIMSEAGGDVKESFREFEQTNPEFAQNIKSTGIIASFLAEFAGVGKAKKVLDDVIEVPSFSKSGLTEELGGIVDNTKNILGEGLTKAKDIELPSVKLPDVSLPKGKTTEQLLDTKEVFDITPDFKKSEKLRPKDIDLGISVADKKALGGKSETTKAYLQEALDTHTNPDAGIGSLADSRVTAKMGEVEKRISDIGSNIGKARQSYSKTKIDAVGVAKASKEFHDELRKLGYRIEGGDLVQIKGRALKLSSAEKSMIKELQSDLKKAESGGNLQEILDRRMNIDTALNKAKSKEGFVDNKTKRLVTGLRKNYKDILTENGGPVNARLTDEYAEMMGVINAYNQASSKGKNLEYFLERIMGTRDAKSRKAFDLIKEKTGIDFMEEATAMKLALKVASKDKTSRLQQAFENAGISIASIVNPKFGLVKLAKDVAGEGKNYLTKRKGVDPEFLNAKNRARIIFEAMQ